MCGKLPNSLKLRNIQFFKIFEFFPEMSLKNERELHHYFFAVGSG